MTELFAPADGVTPRWKKLYDLVLTKEVGGEVTYGEAIETLGLPRGQKSLKIAQAVMLTAQRHLEDEGRNTVGTVARFGWIILDPVRELSQVEQRLVKSRRAARKTVRGAQALNVRREELSQFERQRLDFVSHASRTAIQATSRNGLTLEKFRALGEGKPGA